MALAKDQSQPSTTPSAPAPASDSPFEALTKICKRYNILSCIDGAHSIGEMPVDLTALDLDFFSSGAHIWLYVPRPCAVLYVPKRDQRLMSTLPTSFVMEEANIGNFAYVGTLNDAPYLCIEAAPTWRKRVTWEESRGDEAVMSYMLDLARKGGNNVAEKLGTEVMENEEGELERCTFAVVRLPIDVSKLALGDVEKTGVKMCAWVQKMINVEYETAVVVCFYDGGCWVQLSAQDYLTLEDFEIAGDLLVK
ncbi:hypothetical protein LTR95_019126, partial [Oleoguttula sp. CCFEE 5521]